MHSGNGAAAATTIRADGREDHEHGGTGRLS